MSLSHSRDLQAGSSGLADETHPPVQANSPEHSSFTSFPEGEGPSNPDIPPEPMLNKLYNKVLSLASSGKSPISVLSQQPTSPKDAVPKTQEVTTGLSVSVESSHHSKNSSVTSLAGGESNSITRPPKTLEKIETNSSRQPLMRTAEKGPDILKPVVSVVNALGGLTRSEDEFSAIGSDKAPTDATKTTIKSHLREINLPGLAGFRLTREPSSDSESVSSYSAHPGRTFKSIIGRLKTGDLGREFWMKDETSHECFLCGEKFTTFRRKHHCRICGRIFDDKCTSHIPGSRFGLQEKIRVCNSCRNIMNEYDDLEAQSDYESTQQATVTLNVVPPPPDLEQPDSMLSSQPDSPQVAYTIPTGRRPGTVPPMAIPATRTPIGTSGRHTAVEIPILDLAPSSRPQSSRSNKGLQIGRRRSASFTTASGTRPRSNSIPFEEAYSRAPFHQNMDDDDVLPHDVPMDIEDPFDDISRDESYAPISASRESFLDSPSNEATQQDHLKPPTPVQRHRSVTKASFDEKSRSSKRRSIQNIQRRSRSKSRGHRGSSSIAGDHFRGNDLAPSSGVPTSNSLTLPPSSPVNVVDLNQSSIAHVQKLLTQMLADEGVTNHDAWQKALMPIILKIAGTLDPDVRGMGDDIDVRSYVKIKRLPGGTEADSTYVSGVVFTKNLAHKRMSRTISNPRIMLVTFPIEYHHNEMQLMSLDPMIAQGKEYIHNLVMRIVNHKPSVLVIGNTVSGIALDYLLKYGVSTLYNIKPSVIEALSRCCETDIISSIDKLSSNPVLGTCGQFSVRTSVHHLIPGHKKTLVYLNGCPEDLGCTVVLRGASMQTLSRIKRVVDFMVYVAYSLKLETSLMYDNMINIPSTMDDMEENSGLNQDNDKKTSNSTVYDSLIREFRKIILSASPCVKFPLPELLLKARDSEISANRLRQEHENARAEEQERAAKQETIKETNGTSNPADPEKSSQETEKGSEQPQEQALASSTEINHESYQRRVDNLLHEYRHNRAIQDLCQRHKQWDNFRQQSPELMNPLAYQNIIVLYSNLQKKTSVPCQGPDVHVIDFYSETDCTLGQYVEDLFMHKEMLCEECGTMQQEHVRNYVHNNGRMNVFIEKLPCPLPGMQQSMLMWSWCSQCELTLNVSRMSENSYRYSFGKWLELVFYAKDLKHRGGLCPHDVNRYHVRYFGYDNWAVRFQYDTVDVLSLVVPDMRLTWEPDIDVRLKNEEKDWIAGKVNQFFDSVGDRLKSVSLENIATEKQEPCKAEIAQLLKQALSQRESLHVALEKIWYESMVLDRLPLNRVLKDLQDHVVHWDSQFGEFEKSYLPSDKEVRRLTALQLRKLVVETGLPFMDVLERKASVQSPESIATEEKMATSEPLPVSEKGKDVESSLESVNQPSKPEPEPVSEAIDVPQVQRKEDASPSIQTSSLDSRVSEISEAESDRRTGSAPRTLSVAPKIARLQAEIISPSTSPIRRPLSIPTTPGLTSIAPPRPSSRNLSAQSSESEDGHGFIDTIKDNRSTPRTNPTPSRIPKPKPPQPLTSIHAKSKNGDGITEAGHRRRGSIEDASNRLSRNKHNKQLMSNTIKRLQRVAGTNQSVASLARHFDELSQQYEKEEIKRRKRFGYRRALPVTSAKPKVEVFSNVQDAVQEASDDELGTETDSLTGRHSRKNTMQGPEDVPGDADQGQRISENTSIRSTESDIVIPDRPDEPDSKNITTSPVEITGETEESQEQSSVARPEEVPSEIPPPEETKETLSIMKAITSLWADRSAALWKPLEYPLPPSVHIFSDSDVIVREDEPSSLIAFTLSSQDYELKLNGLKQLASPQPQSMPSNIPNLSTVACGDEIQIQTQSHSPTNDIEAALLKPTGTHMKYQFQEGSATFFCKIFYAEQFDALRINCGCDEHYIQSLSRCLKWDSSGGKSKAAFLKTLDNRLVVKQMSRYEMDAFVKFAPSYFEYMSQAFFHELPTALAKILGVYQIGSRNQVTGKTMKMDVLVMENLFYSRKTTRIFDLKGSMRNRHVQSTGKANEVLLDENLVEFIYESPLFVGQHSKRVLRHSLWNDTLFLAKMNVMDYSLVIGIDEENKDLILGIIDFIRTFTWDKKLESWVKERGFVGGGTKEPTIVTPRQYKNRFRASMERYFLQVPNCFSIHDIRRS